jgi:hypothetical protein
LACYAKTIFTIVNFIREQVQMKKIFWMAFFFFLMGSCLDEPDCVDVSNGFIGISFKKMFDGKADTVAFVGVQSPDSDSIFYQFTRATAIELPLNPFVNQTSYQLVEVYGENFLEMNYMKSTTQFVSEDCGIRHIFSDLEFANYDFDSVKIVTNALASSVQINLEVYRCPRTNLAKVTFRKIVGVNEVADTVYLNNLSADFAAVFFIPNDTLSTINLPLNQNAPSTTFTFDFKDGSSNTITFNYTRTAWDEFQTHCGTQTLFSQLSSSVHDFTDVEIRNDSIQDPPRTNVAIFK